MMIQELQCAQKYCRKGQEAFISCDCISTQELFVDLSSLEGETTTLSFGHQPYNDATPHHR